MKIEIGKTYLTRDGSRKITIEAEFPAAAPTYIMQGIDEHGRITWRSRTGHFVKHSHPLDLVKET